MNYSKAVFLINDNVRAVIATYEATPNAPKTTFKTLDQDIKAGDLVIVPTNTRHEFTVVKLVETDVDIDFDSAEQIQWVVGKVDLDEHKRLLDQEAKAVQVVKSAELKKKRDELKQAIFADHAEKLKTLEIAHAGEDIPAPEQPPTIF